MKMYLSLSINKKKLNIILLNFFYFVMGIYIIEGGGGVSRVYFMPTFHYVNLTRPTVSTSKTSA